MADRSAVFRRRVQHTAKACTKVLIGQDDERSDSHRLKKDSEEVADLISITHSDYKNEIPYLVKVIFVVLTSVKVISVCFLNSIKTSF